MPATRSPATGSGRGRQYHGRRKRREDPDPGQHDRAECRRCRRPPELMGVLVQDTATGTTIGGTSTGAGNTVSGNGARESNSVVRRPAPSSRATRSGSARRAPPSATRRRDRPHRRDRHHDRRDDAAARNVISGNGTSGGAVRHQRHGQLGHRDADRRQLIGTGPSGATAVGNAMAGVTIADTPPPSGRRAAAATSSAATRGPACTYGANGVSSSMIIGLNAGATAAVGNVGAGIEAYNSAGVTIGGTTGLSDSSPATWATASCLRAALRDPDPGGHDRPRRRGHAGGGQRRHRRQRDESASATTIGGHGMGMGNIISGNNRSGVYIAAGPATPDPGQHIGLDLSTMKPRPTAATA